MTARTYRRRRWAAVSALLAGLALAGGALAATLIDGTGEGHRQLRAYLDAWSRGDDRAAAALTDRPRRALRGLAASREGLDRARVTATLGRVREDGGGIVGAARVRWDVPRIGRWSYRVRLRAVDTGDGWKVAWRPDDVHPRLTGATRLGTSHDRPERGRILDREGRALVRDRAVVDVAVQVDRVRDAGATATALAELVDVDPGRLARAVERAPAGRFIPVITLRRPAFDRVAGRLERIPGVSIAEGSAPLAPSKTFARALLGTVAPATAEQLEQARGRLGPGDEVGQWGLQAAHDRRLAGTSTRRIVVRTIADGAPVRTLLTRRGRRGRHLRTTLDAYVQGAAEEALAGHDGNAALVAVQPSTGDILAVANRPADTAYNRALLGLYPPGSTFKVVSTAALLRAGLRVDETVACPKTLAVDGRSFRNFEGGEHGAVPFAVDFAQSCNTAFVALADRLDERALHETAGDYGFGRTLRLGLPAADGRVPVVRDPVERAASMIGQSRIVASPLTMAGVAAAVVEGRWRAPRLLAGDPRRAGPRIDPGEVQALRALMRQVVQTGTGTALAGLAGEPIGKSGTAEYGAGDPPPTHAWFVAARGDLAIAVLVEDRPSGGGHAAPIAARFFAAMDLVEGTP